MFGRIKDDEQSVEMKYRDYFYYSRHRKKGKDQGNYALACRKFKSMDAPEEIIFDGDLESRDTKYFSPATGLSLCQKYLAIATDKIGNEEYDLIIRDIKTKKILSKDIKTSGNFVWAKNDYLFYTVLNKERRPYKIMRHSLGGDPQKDIKIFEEKDPSFFVSCGKPVILLQLNLMPYLWGIFNFSIISLFFHFLSKIFFLNSSFPCSTPKDILCRPTSANFFILYSVTVSGLVCIQNGNFIPEYISQNSSNSLLFIAKKVSAQK